MKLKHLYLFIPFILAFVLTEGHEMFGLSAEAPVKATIYTLMSLAIIVYSAIISWTLSGIKFPDNDFDL